MDPKIKKLIKYALFAFTALIIVVGTISSYNSMVRYDETSNQAWAQVQNVYQRRTDLIPSLVEIVQGAANFEKSTLTDVVNARAKATSITIDPSKSSAADLLKFQQAQDNLGSTLSRLMVVVEKYPDLKSNQSFLELQSQLEGTENRIAVERKKFNESIQYYNQYIRLFPKNILSGMFGFDKKAYFEADYGANKAPKIKFGTN
jgi:LemA protein